MNFKQIWCTIFVFNLMDVVKWKKKKGYLSNVVYNSREKEKKGKKKNSFKPRIVQNQQLRQSVTSE